MCTLESLRIESESRRSLMLSRRQFNLLSFSAASIAMLPGPAEAAPTSGSMVNIPTSDGFADCFFVHPTKAKSPCVVMWPDFMSLRPAYERLARRLAEAGYAVLVVNQYYRLAKSPIVQKVDFDDKEAMARIAKYSSALNGDQIKADAKAFIRYLDLQPSVDAARPAGVVGYCMGGGFAFDTAAVVPDRVGGMAIFHASGLVSDQADSVHLLVPNTKAKALIAIAESDDQDEPQSKTVLKQAYAKAQLSAEISVFKGTNHGWCIPDMTAYYNAKQAGVAWGRLLAHFGKALA